MYGPTEWRPEARGGQVVKRRIRALLISWAFATQGLQVARLEAQHPVTLTEIELAWQRRDQRIRVGEFEWTESQTDPKGSVSAVWRFDNPKENRVIPPSDTTIENACRLLFDGTKLRYSNAASKWSTKTGRYEPTSYLSVFDGTVCKTLEQYGPNHAKFWPQANVLKERRHIDGAVAQLQPILMAYRGATPKMSAHSLREFELTGQSLNVDGAECLELRRRTASAHSEKRLWVDPSRGFLIVRYLRLQEGIVTLRIDVGYEKEDEWIPKRWQISFHFPDGNLKRSLRAEVTACRLNQPVKESEFQISFPLGSRVHDAVSNRDYIVKPDGSGEREVLREDVGATYEEMIRTLPGQARHRSVGTGRLTSWGLFVAVAIVAAIASWTYYRLRVRPKGASR